MSIRAATEDDIPRILEIENDTIAPPWTHGGLLSEIYRDDSFFVVSFMGEHKACPYGIDDNISNVPGPGILGFVILRQTAEDEGELLQIAVDNSARRRGIADLLMGAALRYSDEHSLMSVFLEVRKSNDAAVSLYKKHGFVTVRVRKGYYSDPAEDAVVMVRDFHH